jgi:hypothetical protein
VHLEEVLVCVCGGGWVGERERERERGRTRQISEPYSDGVVEENALV